MTDKAQIKEAVELQIQGVKILRDDIGFAELIISPAQWEAFKYLADLGNDYLSGRIAEVASSEYHKVDEFYEVGKIGQRDVLEPIYIYNYKDRIHKFTQILDPEKVAQREMSREEIYDVLERRRDIREKLEPEDKNFIVDEIITLLQAKGLL